MTSILVWHDSTSFDTNYLSLNYSSSSVAFILPRAGLINYPFLMSSSASSTTHFVHLTPSNFPPEPRQLQTRTSSHGGRKSKPRRAKPVTRSLDGCLNCRLQKKKCGGSREDGGPGCATCHWFRFECLGFPGLHLADVCSLFVQSNAFEGYETHYHIVHL